MRGVTATILLGSVFLMQGCFSFFGNSAYVVGSKEKAAQINRRKLSKIEKGMSKDKVIGIMGDRDFSLTIMGAHLIGNPALVGKDNAGLNDIVEFKNGEYIEIIYYFTHTADLNYKAYKKECTPMVFKDNILIGWGNSFLNRYVNEQSGMIIGSGPTTRKDVLS